MTTEEKKDKKAKGVYVGVIILLCLMFVVLFVYSYIRVIGMEGKYPEMFFHPAQSVIEVPENEEAGAKLLENALSYALEGKLYTEGEDVKSQEILPEIEGKRSFSLEAVSSADENESSEFEAVLDYVADNIEDALNSSFETEKVEFGQTDRDGFVSAPVIPEADITDFTCTYEYYQCPSCGEKSDEMLDSCTECGYAFSYTYKNYDEYDCTVTIAENASEETIALFENLTADDYKKLLADSLGESAEIVSLDVKYYDYSIIYKVNRLNGKISRIEYKKFVDITAEIEFTGSYAFLGTKTVSVTCKDSNRYSFTWPGISLNAHELAVEPASFSDNESLRWLSAMTSNDNLLATLTCDDATKYTVVWTSDDESVVTVDDKGYLVGIASGEGRSTTVTASFVFEINGQSYEYSDSCFVTVQNSVESQSISKRHATLGAGDTIQLNTTVSPKKSTFKGVRAWTSSDESVATVDENGLVTAVGTGTATISAYSEDGAFKSTCEVTVR